MWELWAKTSMCTSSTKNCRFRSSIYARYIKTLNGFKSGRSSCIWPSPRYNTWASPRPRQRELNRCSARYLLMILALWYDFQILLYHYLDKFCVWRTLGSGGLLAWAWRGCEWAILGLSPQINKTVEGIMLMKRILRILSTQVLRCWA